MNSAINREKKKRLVSVEDLYEMSQIGEIFFRPQTTEVYYSLTRANKEDNGYRTSIWRYRDKQPKQFTQGLPRDSFIRWSPDGSKLAFISVRAVTKKPSNGKTDPPKPQIFLMPYDGGEAIQLTKAKNGVSYFEWSQDSKKIAYLSPMNQEELNAPSPDELKELDPDQVALLKLTEKKKEKAKKEPRVITRTIYRAGTSFLSDKLEQLFVLDIESKKSERWSDAVDKDISLAGLLPDNSVAIAGRQKPGTLDESREYEILKIYPDKKIEVLAENYGWGLFMKLSPDGKFVSTTEGDKKLGTLGFPSLVIYSIADGSKKVLAQRIDAPKYSHTWSEDSKFLYFIVQDKGSAGIWRVDIETDKVEKIVGGNRVITAFDISKDGEWLTFQAHHVSDPSKLYRYHIPTKKEEILHEPNKAFLEKRKLGETETIWYEGADGDFKIQGWVLTPPDFDPEKKYPLALNMHGGPHVMWSNHQGIPMFHEFQLLAAEGYVVFYCNPRGSSGYGLAFHKSIEKSWGEKDSQDILLGVDQVVARGFIDKKRMAITGGSYAGFMTAWIVGHDNRFAAAVAQRGVYFLSSFWGTSDARMLVNDEFGTTPLDGHDFLWKWSPAAYAKNITTPIRIIHSDLDYRAPIPDAELLYVAIRHQHPELDVEFVRYPGEGHELSRSGQPSRRLDRLHKIIEWFDKYCQPKKYKKKQKLEEKISAIKKDFATKVSSKIKDVKKKG